jgi:branched-chain amino acid transport system ATP-binding protein
MSLLELDSVAAYYDQSRAIEDITFDVEQGEVLAMFGRNGAGKTTTLRSIVGALHPREGTVRFKDRDVTQIPKFERVRMGIGYVPEDRQVWSNLTVHENLSVPAGRGGDRTIEEVFELFPALDQLQGARAGTLSGGEQQMLAMGRGLLGGTEMLLLDEPTEGLAPKIVADVRDAITRLADELTVVLVEQNLDLALSVADSVVVLANGELVHRADADELSPNDKVLREYISI